MSSSYKIDFNDGTSNPGNNPIAIARDDRDQESVDVTLFGRGTFSYGESLNENLLHLLEHFASHEAERDIAVSVEERRDRVANIRPHQNNWVVTNPSVGQLWANKTNEHLHVLLQNTRKWDALMNSGDVTVNWGVIADDQTIPLPVSATGYVYTDDECAWIVSPSAYGDSTAYMTCTAAARKVTARAGASASVNSPIAAHYMIIGIRDNVNVGSSGGTAGASGQTLSLSTTPLAVMGLTNTPINGVITVTTVDSLGNAVPAANLTYTWYRVTEGGDAACTTVQYNDPVQNPDVNGVFTFTAVSQFPLMCNPSWRVVAQHTDGRRGEAIVQMVWNFQAPQTELVVSTTSISYANAPTNEIASATVNATITGGVGPFTIEWSEEAVDGSGAIKTSQDPAISPPVSSAGTSLLTTATYSLQRASAQTIFTRVAVTVSDSEGRQTRSFTTIRYNFIAADEGSIPPEQEPLQMNVDGTLEGVYTIEGSAYIEPTAGADTRVFTLEIPVQVIGTAQGTSLAITRLRDTDRVQFNLISPAFVSNATSAVFTFAISANTASAYPGSNSDAWRITFVAQDGRTVSRDVITKFNYLTTLRPLSATVSSPTVIATAASEPTPAPTYVTLSANVQGGLGPFTYLWDTSAISDTAPFKVVGAKDRPTLTLQLRGTTFNNAQFDDVVWPAPTPGTQNFAYSIPVSVVVRDSSSPSQQVTAEATASIRFNVDSTAMTVAPSYHRQVADYTPNSNYSMKGDWICNPSFNGTGTYEFPVGERVSIDVIRGSGSYTYTWTEEARAGGSTLTPVIVIPDTTQPNKLVTFRAQETNCAAGVRQYEGTWRCNVVDNHTGKTLIHRDRIQIKVCSAAPGAIPASIARVPAGVGFSCA